MTSQAPLQEDTGQDLQSQEPSGSRYNEELVETIRELKEFIDDRFEGLVKSMNSLEERLHQFDVKLKAFMQKQEEYFEKITVESVSNGNK